ncbi:hypothetical protein MASR2M18_14840 [Ignavibacteria bacterium]|nr:hypothetical protein [Bacteroidota bacterium]MCZ2133001.1 hypothetical protein [Bacteroidota bacterium]
MKYIFLVLALLVTLLWPDAIMACPLCQSDGGVSPQTVSAYKGITLFLAVLPLAGAGGVFYWIYVKNKRFENNGH